MNQIQNLNEIEMKNIENELNKALRKKKMTLNNYLIEVAKITKIPNNIQTEENLSLLKIIIILENQISFLKGLNIKNKKQKEMTKIEKQYHTFLETINIAAIEQEIEKRTTIVEDLRKYMELDKDKNLQPFTSFYTLTMIINDLYNIKQLTKEEYLDIIMYFISLNVELGILEPEGIKKIKTTHELDKKILVYLQKHNVDPNTINIMEIAIDINNIDFKKTVITATQNIQEHYLNKKTTYNEEDIEAIINSLKQLQIFSIANDIIRRTLLKKLKTNEKKQKNVTIKRKVIEIAENGKIKLTPSLLDNKQKKDENNNPITIRPFFTATLANCEIDKKKTSSKTTQKIKEELQKYIDLYNFKIKQPLLPNQIYYITELLSDLEKERNTIHTFITNAHLKLSQIIPTSNIKTLRQIFAENREKYYFYYEKKGYIQLEEHLKFLEEVFNLLAQEQDINTISYFEEEIKNELLTLENICPATYEYEFRKLEKHKQKKKY